MDEEITRMRSGSDERTSSPVFPDVTDVAAMSHVALSHASAIGNGIGKVR